MEHDIKKIALEFIEVLQHRTNAETLLGFYHNDVQQIEYPNAVTKHTAIRNLDDLKVASERGKAVMQKEVYEVIKSYTFENTVIIEALRTGTLL